MKYDLNDFKNVSNYLYEVLIELDDAEEEFELGRDVAASVIALNELLTKKEAIVRTFDLLTGRGQFLYDVTRVRTDNKLGHWVV